MTTVAFSGKCSSDDPFFFFVAIRNDSDGTDSSPSKNFTWKCHTPQVEQDFTELN
jgi:hypothetical protein